MKQSWALKEIMAKKELENSKRNPLFKDKNKLSLSSNNKFFNSFKNKSEKKKTCSFIIFSK